MSLRSEQIGAWAELFDALDEDLQHYQQEADDHLARLRQAVPLAGNLRVLDFGCGFGFVAERLAAHVGELYIWDISKRMRDVARARLRRFDDARLLDLSGNVSVPDTRLDVIIVNSVVQYMALGEFLSWLDRWQSMLVPGGRAIISDIIPERPRFFTELTESLIFATRRGFLLRSLYKAVIDLRHYTKTRSRNPLLWLSRDRLRREAQARGWEVQFLPDNLTYRRSRTAVVLTKPAN